MSDAPDWTIPTSIRAQEIETVKVDISAQSLDKVDVNFVSQEADINVNVTNSSLNVNVQGTADVNIAKASVYLNVKQDDYLGQKLHIENFSLSSANIDINLYNNRYGFWFMHRARGFIERVRLYAKNITGSDQTITIRICIAPKRPAILTLSATIPASQTEYDYVDVTGINCLWNYDTIYVEIEGPDGIYLRGKSGLWGEGGFRNDNVDGIVPWIMVWLAPGTRGDIPVSGTVNTIQIPNTTSSAVKAGTSVPASSSETLIDISATGTVKWLAVSFEGTDSQLAKVQIEVDDVLIWDMSISDTYRRLGFSQGGAGSVVYITQYDTTNNYYAIVFNNAFSFKRRFKVTVKNESTSNSITATAMAIISKLT